MVIAEWLGMKAPWPTWLPSANSLSAGRSTRTDPPATSRPTGSIHHQNARRLRQWRELGFQLGPKPIDIHGRRWSVSFLRQPVVADPGS